MIENVDPVFTNLFISASLKQTAVVRKPPSLEISFSLYMKQRALSTTILAVSLYPGSTGKVSCAVFLVPFEPSAKALSIKNPSYISLSLGP